MAEIARPNRALRSLGILFLLIGIAWGVISYVRNDESSGYSYYPQICEGALDYDLAPINTVIVVDLKPDCWSGKVPALYWDTEDHTAPDALFSDSYIHKGNRTAGMELIPHPYPVRFRGTGKIRITLIEKPLNPARR